MEAKPLLALALTDPAVRAMTLEEFARLVLSAKGPPPAPPRPPRATPEDVLKALDGVKQGLRIEQVKSKIGKDPKPAMEELLREGRVKKKGEKRATTYTKV